MYREEIRIPKERVAVLIGRKGKIKKKIENNFNVKMSVDSKECVIRMEGENSIDIFNAKPVVKAICRGFSPKTAELLLNEDNIIEFINIQDFSGKSRKKYIRLKSRVIGNKGKARESIEEITNTKIVIYGKTIGIIGKVEDVMIAKGAFENLLKGAPHGNVYRGIIERKKKINN